MSSPEQPPVQTKDDFLSRVNQLEKRGKTDSALDLLYDQVDYRINAGRFSDLETALQEADVDALSLNILLGLLTATLPARTKIESRGQFYKRVETALRLRGELADGLLVGLES